MLLTLTEMWEDIYYDFIHTSSLSELEFSRTALRCVVSIKYPPSIEDVGGGGRENVKISHQYTLY